MMLFRRLARRVSGQASAAPASSAEPMGGDGAELVAVVAHATADTAAGRYSEALKCLAAGLARFPTDPDLLMARAATLAASGRLREAADVAMRAVVAQPCATGLAVPLLLGRIHFQAGDPGEAARWFRAATAAAPRSIDAHVGMGGALHAQGRVDDAIAAYRHALAIDARDLDGLIGLGNCLLDRGELANAEEQFRKAIDIDAEYAVAWRFLGLVLDRGDREDETIAAHRRAAAIEDAHGQDDGAFLGLAASLRDAGRFAEALAVLEPNLQRLPGADAQLLYGHMLLAVGRLPEGWHHSEFRFLTPHFLARRPQLGRPAWSGQDLQGRTVLLRAEQGIGDTLQFARYAALVKALSATVHIAVPPELARLAEGIAGVDRVFVIRQDESASQFDYHVPLLSLPRIFGTDLASVPAAVPYVHADPERAQRWAARLAGDRAALRVGLVWGGNPRNAEDRFRSLPLSALAPLAGIPGVRYYALQKGPREHDADTPPPGLDIVNLGPELADFADTAAVVAQLDLVVSVCTSVAHLAGAMGKPLWVMLHRAADWRWLTERSDCPWYPTARLFRQTRRGEWSDVVDGVRAALAQRVREREPEAAPPRPAQRVVLPEIVHPAKAPGFRPGFSAVAETRAGVMEHFPDDGGEGTSLGWYGEWLQPQVERLARMVEPGSTVVEVGAGAGAHSLALAAAVGAAGQLLVYEPRPVLRRVLRLNLAANGVACATVMRRRLAAARPAGAPAPDPAIGLEPATETLDDLWLERLDWLVVHAGAAAADVLDGAAASLWRLRPRVHVGADDAAALASWADRLRNFGYRCWRGEVPLHNPDNFNRRAGDIFAGRRAVALVATPEEGDANLARAGYQALS